jgi:hypothetical protein
MMLKKLSRLFCKHEWIRKFGCMHLYLECMKCGKNTSGIYVVDEGFWRDWT